MFEEGKGIGHASIWRKRCQCRDPKQGCSVWVRETWGGQGEGEWSEMSQRWWRAPSIMCWGPAGRLAWPKHKEQGGRFQRVTDEFHIMRRLGCNAKAWLFRQACGMVVGGFKTVELRIHILGASCWWERGGWGGSGGLWIQPEEQLEATAVVQIWAEVKATAMGRSWGWPETWLESFFRRWMHRAFWLMGHGD